ncbi:MAG: hypothetical protein FJW69_09185 [Actinobacteria bacterium]|nr:hypothetical protein [Actinomycetota bacterium]
MSEEFIDILKDVKAIKVKELLAETLGAFKVKDAVLDYTFIDTIKMAGHVCPTVASAYVCCQEALKVLYPDGIPVRGEIEVLIYGEPDEGSYGVIGQVFSFLTGAAPETGFKGLGHKFKRKNLLKYSSEKIDPEALAFKFTRIDNRKSVTAKLFPGRFPYDQEAEQSVGKLLEKIIWEAASDEEKENFKSLWIKKIINIVVDKKDINSWLILEEGGTKNE